MAHAWEDFGQKVDLAARLREILLNYPEVRLALVFVVVGVRMFPPKRPELSRGPSGSLESYGLDPRPWVARLPGHVPTRSFFTCQPTRLFI